MTHRMAQVRAEALFPIFQYFLAFIHMLIYLFHTVFKLLAEFDRACTHMALRLC